MMVKVHFMKVLVTHEYVRASTTYARSLCCRETNQTDEKLVLPRLVRDAILSIVRQLDRGNVSQDMTDYLAFRLDQLYGHIFRLTASNPNLRGVEPLICEAARSLRILVGMSGNDCYELPLEHSGHVGRPRFGVSKAQLDYLLQNDFTGKQTSEMLSISLSTVRRRMRDFNLSVRDLYSSFSEEELDNALHSILRDFPNCGYRRAFWATQKQRSVDCDNGEG